MLRALPEEGGGTPVETLPSPSGWWIHPPMAHGGPDLDDGPYAVHTDQILDILEEHGAVATFFEVARISPRRDAEAVRRAAT